LYESGEGERRGIVGEEVADVIEEESELQTTRRSVGAVFKFVSLSLHSSRKFAIVPLSLTASQLSNLLRLSMWAYSRIGLGMPSRHGTIEAASHSQSIFWASAHDYGSYPTSYCVFTVVLYHACKQESGLWLMSVDLSLGTSS
jgi:hypothetical protein